MIAYDYLIQSMKQKAIINHSGSLKPDYINNDANKGAHEIKYHSIYDSKLPDLMFDEEVKDFRKLFRLFMSQYLSGSIKVYLKKRVQKKYLIGFDT